MTDRDHYQVLGVSRDASPAVIRAAYVRLAKRHHPDVAGAASMPNRLTDLQAAYRCLADPERRAAHDREVAAQEERHHARRQALDRRLRRFDKRHPQRPPRVYRQRRWPLLVAAMTGVAIAAGISLGWFG